MSCQLNSVSLAGYTWRLQLVDRLWSTFCAFIINLLLVSSAAALTTTTTTLMRSGNPRFYLAGSNWKVCLAGSIESGVTTRIRWNKENSHLFSGGLCVSGSTFWLTYTRLASPSLSIRLAMCLLLSFLFTCVFFFFRRRCRCCRRILTISAAYKARP